MLFFSKDSQERGVALSKYVMINFLEEVRNHVINWVLVSFLEVNMTCF